MAARSPPPTNWWSRSADSSQRYLVPKVVLEVGEIVSEARIVSRGLDCQCLPNKPPSSLLPWLRFRSSNLDGWMTLSESDVRSGCARR